MRDRSLAAVVGVLIATIACGSSSDTSTGFDASNGSGGSNGGSGGSSGVSGSGGASGSGASSGAGGTSDAGVATCRADSECGLGWFCAVYTLPPLCGGQVDQTSVNDCQTDADCAEAGAMSICDATLCDFLHGGGRTPLHCRDGCVVAADCGPGLDCDVAHRCVPLQCTQASDCGTDNFTCRSGLCTAKLCTTDAVCVGYCVNAMCSATIGQCTQMVP